jgi:hypothetical protein
MERAGMSGSSVSSTPLRTLPPPCSAAGSATRSTNGLVAEDPFSSGESLSNLDLRFPAHARFQRHFLLALRDRLRLDADMAAAADHPSSARYRHGLQSVHRSHFLRRKLPS